MKFLCLACDMWNMDWGGARIHKARYPDHEIRDTLGIVRLDVGSRKTAETKTYEGYGRLGRDFYSGSPFFSEAPSMSNFGYLILNALEERDSDKVHNLTCGIVKFNTRSITGDPYLAEKCIKYRIKISVVAVLVDDRPMEAAVAE